MRKPSWYIMAAGLFLAVLISNLSSFISDGQKLDELRGSVLRLHILANSDSDRDQRLKLKVRDRLLESEIFGKAESLSEAEGIAVKKLGQIERIAEKVLRENGCMDKVSAEIADVKFDERIYGDITMPSGTYRALRIKIGKSLGHNWWCVMYPPLCLPAACEVGEEQSGVQADVAEDKAAEEEHFDEKELDMLRKPQKYKVRFAIWDKIKSVFSDDVV
ncbi:MAG: stage II sporulation protein R [Ruminococcus sp.]|uniref:stage II sporulation protein R n=1 Tax=Ruminococcus sp. TaxID=41978 RepID=UPI0025D4D8A8|nr:stage II sporulation protein R [Ruminococcus sp.]MCR5599513.1 stage II sporulation protein R [Ruminococcus sp.]